MREQEVPHDNVREAREVVAAPGTSRAARGSLQDEGPLPGRALDGALDRIVAYHRSRLRDAVQRRRGQSGRHVGLELKFPVVDGSGRAAGADAIHRFWEICREAGWELDRDGHSGQVVCARTASSDNPDLIRTTTGICVLEFSIAHAPDLFSLQRRIGELRPLVAELRRLAGVHLLGLGIQPLTPPQNKIRHAKGRHLFWDQVIPPRSRTPHGHRGTVDLFTVIADNQVHVDGSPCDCIDALNTLNALAGPQLALTANSSVWAGQSDDRHAAVRELFWDWWLGDSPRAGMPTSPFTDFADYVRATALLRPVYARRDGDYLGLQDYPSFLEFFAHPTAQAVTTEGRRVGLEPGGDDIDLHDRAFWWNCRLSRFGTIESRTSCQQPPDEMLLPAALVLGVMENLDAARGLWEHLAWSRLRGLRQLAAHGGLGALEGPQGEPGLVRAMLAVAEEGLRKRGLGEETFLAPGWQRVATGREPASCAREVFGREGVEGLIDRFGW